MERIILIYGNRSFKKDNKIFVNKFDFISPSADTKSIKLAIEELNKISNSKIDERIIPELLTYDTISMWWLCYERLTTFFIDTIPFIKNFMNFIKSEKICEIRLENDFTQIHLIKEIADYYKIKFSYSKTNLIKFTIAQKFRKKAKIKAANFLTNKKINSRKKLFYKKFSNLPDLNNKILFVSYSTYRRLIYDFHTNSSKTGEFLINDIIELLQISKKSIGIDLFTSPLSDNKVLEQRQDDEIPWFPIDIILKSRNMDSHKEFLKKFEKLIKSEKFINLFKFENISYSKETHDFLESFKLDYHLPYWLNIIDSTTNYFKIHRPKSIFLLFETTPTSLAIIIACKKLNIKTIGLQHGIIHNSHHLYMHDSFFSEQTPYGFILPENLLLFGNITKNYLLEKNYPPQVLIPFCNTAFLNVDKIKNIREKIFSKFNLDSNKQIILFAPPGLKDFISRKDNYNFEILKKLIDSFSNNSDVIIIIKPHPLDDISDYSKLVDQSSSNCKILDGNLLELLSVSSLLISTFSTTMIDSMSMKIPVIQVTFPNVVYERPYDNYGAVLKSNIEELSVSINKLLEDKNLQKKLIANGSKFVKDYYNLPIENPEKILKDILS